MIFSAAEVTPEAMQREMTDVARRFEVDDVEQLLRFPKYFQIETTRLCNARCGFCAIDLWDKSTPFMSDELFEKIASELLLHRDWVKFVDLQRAGEPLLDRKIYDRVSRLKAGGMPFVAITTNASALNSHNARRLLEAGIDEVMLSIDAVEKHAYEKLRVGLKFETVIRNIEQFFELRDQLHPECLVRVRGVSFHDTANPDDMKAIDDWERFWNRVRKPHDRIYMKRAHTWGNQKIVDGHSPEYDWVWHPCVIPFSTMHISAMGTVALCPQDFDAKADLGDINTMTIAEVWNGEKLRHVRELHRSGRRNEINFCQGCRLFDEEFSLERNKDKARGGARPSSAAIARDNAVEAQPTLLGIKRSAKIIA